MQLCERMSDFTNTPVHNNLAFFQRTQQKYATSSRPMYQSQNSRHTLKNIQLFTLLLSLSHSHTILKDLTVPVHKCQSSMTILTVLNILQNCRPLTSKVIPNNTKNTDTPVSKSESHPSRRIFSSIRWSIGLRGCWWCTDVAVLTSPLTSTSRSSLVRWLFTLTLHVYGRVSLLLRGEDPSAAAFEDQRRLDGEVFGGSEW